MQPLGINVTVVEPGAFRTDFAGRSLTLSATAIDDYGDTAGKRRKENDTVHGTQLGDPAKAAEHILAAFDAVAQAQRAELDQWRELSLSTGIEG